MAGLDDFLAASDTARMQGGGRSIFDKVYDAATAGTAGAVVSGLASIYNTGVRAANLFGAQAEEIKTAEVLGNVDSNWRQYYEENAQVIDTVGFIGGSFIPGGIALKGLQLARAGKSAGTFKTVLGYTQQKQFDALDAGLKEVAKEGGTIFNRINSKKLTSMAWGTADNVLQTAVFETAAATTMQASPFFAGDSFGDIAWDITKTSLAGGFLGGAVEALFTNRIFKDVGKLVDKGQRKYDTVVQLEKMGMNFGDETFNLTDELFKLPKEVLAADKGVKFNYRMNGQNRSVDLDLEGLYDRKLQETTRRTLQTIEAKLANIVNNDTSVGRPLAVAMTEIIQEGLKDASSVGSTREKLGQYLFGLKNVEGMDQYGITDFTRDVLYLNPKASVVKDGKVQDLFTTARVGDKDQAYYLVGNMTDAKIAVIGTEAPTTGFAFKSGYDAAIDIDGTLKVNPDSEIFRPISKKAEQNASRTIFNTRTKTTMDNAVPTIADVQTAKVPLVVSGNVVSAGTKSFRFAIDKLNKEADSIENTARNLWAAGLEKVENTVIDATDFAVLDAIVQKPAILGEKVKIRNTDGVVIPITDINDFTSWVVNKKLEYVIAKLDEAGTMKMQADNFIREGMEVPTAVRNAMEPPDLRDLAYKTNSEVSWLLNAVENEFNNTKLLTPEASRPLSSYAARENLVLVYDPKIKAQLDKGDFPDAIVAYEERKTVSIQKAQEAAAAVLKGDYEKFIDVTAGEITKKFESTGSGATGFGFSNADYGDLPRMWAQEVGKTVHIVSQKRVNDTLTQLQASAAKIATDEKLGAELAAVLTKVRRSQEPLTLAARSDGALHLVDLKSQKEFETLLRTAGPDAAQDVKFKTEILLSPDVALFLGKHHEIHQRQLGDRIQLANAQGTTLHWDPAALYVPPIDTRKVPYFAFVRQKEGAAFATSEVAMITARTPDELQQLASAVGDNYDVIFKGDTELYYKALGDYDYSRALNQPTLDPFLRKQGKLGDFLPSLDGKAAMEDFIQYHTRKEQQLTRDAVEVKYAQTFAELRWLSEQNTKVEKSKFSFLGKQSLKTITDPFGDYIKTALNISKRAEYTLWQNANEFVDALGTRAYQAVEKATQDARAGKITWEEGNALMERMGLGGPFKSQEDFLLAQVGNDRNLIKQAVAKGNMLLATVGLRLDWANSLLNIISTPIMLATEMSAIKAAIGKDSELAGKLRELTHVLDPGTKTPVPTTRKLLMNAMANYWTPAGKEMVAGRYKEIGAIKDVLSMHHDMMADLALTPDMVPRKWADKVGNWTEKAATITGNNFSEQFTRFVSADVMRQLTDPVVAAGKMSVKEQNAYISIFVNRVQGNYIASQRPIAFQGTIGSAIGLFQTYQFNLFQQLFRHIEDRNLKTIGVMAGLQTSIFGLNGLPLFEAVNTQLIGQANINQGHHDAYSFAVQAAGKEMGDWLMYGSASAFPFFSEKMPALYSRGDLNPRHVTIIPTTPGQVPIVEASTRIVSNLANMAKMLGNDADVLSTFLFGLEHNGVSRPLAGIAQTVQGFSTTSKGTLIGQSSDFSAIATSSRVLGARPMDEAIALSAKFRLEGYRAADRERIEELGTAVKAKIRAGTLESEDILDLQARYAEIGGRVDTFHAALQRWQKGANQSVVNVMADSGKTAYSQRLNQIMGSDRLDDARYQESETEQ
jgi:hypothetical protein